MHEIELISSIKHPAIKQARADLGRIVGKWHDTYAIEGYNMLRQALDAASCIQQVFFREPVDGVTLPDILSKLQVRGIPFYRVTSGVFSRLMALGYETSSELLATVRPTQVGWDSLKTRCDEQTIVLVGESIQDPRNVGVLIRNADAWGAKFIVFGDSADAYSRASVRSSTGSVMRLPIMQLDDLPPAIGRLKDMGFRIIGSSAAAQTPIGQADLSPPCVLVVGNESVGLTDAIRTQCDDLVRIPMYGGAHSLNVTVAAGVLLYEATIGRSPKTTSSE